MLCICLCKQMHHHNQSHDTVYVMRQQDHLLSCQLCGADALRFPPGGGNAFNGAVRLRMSFVR